MKNIRLNFKSLLLYHIAFWLTMVASYIFDIASIAKEYPVQFIVSILIRISLLCMVTYINLYFLIPTFIKKRKYFLYILGTALVITVFAYLFKGTYFVDDNSIFAYKDPIQFGNNFFLGFRYILISTLFYFLKLKFDQEKVIDNMKIDYLNTELLYLKAQINPHFLFNSLNNLYSLSLKQSPKTPELILRLSEMMEYMLHETRNDKIALEKDLAHISNYIEFEKIRKDESNNITYSIQGDAGGIYIAPMLMLPLIENAFKHGFKSGSQHKEINISILIKDKALFFKCINSTTKKNSSGTKIGIPNLQKRLDLFYPNKYELNTNITETIFEATLFVQL